MNLMIRLLRVLLTALRAPPLGPLEESVVRFRVLPNDLDVNLHMNNGRYLTLMDLGRLDLFVRLGVLGELRRRGWNPVVGSQTVRYRRSLCSFQSFAIHTRILCWDDRAFYLEQRYTRAGELMAMAIVQGIFVGPDGPVPPRDVVDATRFAGMESPPMPGGVRAWVEAERVLQDQTRLERTHAHAR